jgi:hypothetical protein
MQSGLSAQFGRKWWLPAVNAASEDSAVSTRVTLFASFGKVNRRSLEVSLARVAVITQTVSWIPQGWVGRSSNVDAGWSQSNE